MTNPLNHGVLTGRVTQDIKEFANNDGSKVLLVTLAAEDNFRSGADKAAKTQFIPTRVFIPKSVDGRGSWDRVGKGDLISVNTRLACTPYQKDGQTVYPDVSVEIDGYPQFLESKAITEARAARNAVAAPAAPANETDEQKIARLTAELAAQTATPNYDETSPFAGS